MKLAALFFDGTFVAHLAQDALQLSAHGILVAEGAGDFAGADFAALRGDEGKNIGLGGQGGWVFR